MGLWYKEDFNLEGLQSQIAGSFPLSSLLLITFVLRSARRVGSYGIGLVLHGLIRSRKEGLGRAETRRPRFDYAGDWLEIDRLLSAIQCAMIGD